MIDSFILRVSLAIVMFAHSAPSIVTGDVINFGKEYLAHEGFGILGLPLAIVVKGIHLFSVYALLSHKFLKIISVLNIIILITGIIMIHGAEGWYVVGAGRNGIEFNFILIFIFLSFLFPNGILNSK